MQMSGSDITQTIEAVFLALKKARITGGKR